MDQPLAIVMSQWQTIPASFLWTLSYHNGVYISDLRNLQNTRLGQVFSSFIIARICGSVKCLTSDTIIDWPRETRTARIMALIILQWRGSMRITCGFSTELIRDPATWFVDVNLLAHRGRITHYGAVGDQQIDHFLVLFLFHFPFYFRTTVFQHGASLISIDLTNRKAIDIIHIWKLPPSRWISAYYERIHALMLPENEKNNRYWSFQKQRVETLS